MERPVVRIFSCLNGAQWNIKRQRNISVLDLILPHFAGEFLIGFDRAVDYRVSPAINNMNLIRSSCVGDIHPLYVTINVSGGKKDIKIKDLSRLEKVKVFNLNARITKTPKSVLVFTDIGAENGLNSRGEYRPRRLTLRKRRH
ncbi:hypothetical protein GCM10022398_21010 [Acetobacter lovaniensis]